MWQWRCFGWYDTVLLSCLVSNVYFKCKVQDFLYHIMDIGTMWHCASFSCTQSESIGLVLGHRVLLFSLSWCWVPLCVPFTYCLTEFYFTIIIITGILWPFFLYIVLHVKAFCNLVILVLQINTSLNVSAPGHSLWILDWICYIRTPLYLVYIIY